MAKLPLTLPPEQVTHLRELPPRGTVAVKPYRRAPALLARPAGQSYTAVAARSPRRGEPPGARQAQPPREEGTDTLRPRPGLVLDKLSPHARSTFYDGLPAAQAGKLAARFERCYTPKGGAWLKLIEQDFSALARQGLKRGLPPQAHLASQVYCWSRQRHEQGLRPHWPFTVEQARQALNSQDQKGNRAHKKYQNTS